MFYVRHARSMSFSRVVGDAMPRGAIRHAVDVTLFARRAIVYDMLRRAAMSRRAMSSKRGAGARMMLTRARCASAPALFMRSGAMMSAPGCHVYACPCQRLIATSAPA